MSETKEKHATFTPGPWTFTLADENSAGGVYGGEKCVCEIIPKELEVAWACEEVSIANANARLIAAAPALHAQAKILERLLFLLLMRGETGTDEALEEVRAVLAKVDGGEA
jgi:hypothetical protein